MPDSQASGLNRRLLRAPASFVTGYFLFGIGIATFGPLAYAGYRPLIVALYIVFILILFNIGFRVGIGKKLPVKAIWRKDQNRWILKTLFRISLVISVLLMTYELMHIVQAGDLTLNLANSAAAYFETYDGYTRNSGNYSTRFILTSLGAYPVFVAQVLGLFYFKSLNLQSKAAVVYILVLTVLVYTLGGGKQKQFGDLIIYVVSLLFAHRASVGRIHFPTIFKVSALLVAGVYVLLALLAFRYQAIGVSLNNLNVKLHPLIEYRDGGWLVNTVGDALAFPIVMFSGYLGQGYYGLSLSLEQPFFWTAFAGSSYSVSVILNQFLGTEFWVAQSYPYRVGFATGWDQSKWHTVFSWLASDLTFAGVGLFMAFMGFIYGRVWKEILLFRNPFSIMVFATMNIGFAYAPANNQLMHTPGALSSSLAIFLFYFLFHANFNAAPTELGKRRPSALSAGPPTKSGFTNQVLVTNLKSRL